MGCDIEDLHKWLNDTTFVNAVESRHASLAREGRWMLMRYRDQALGIYQKGMTGERVSTAEEKISNNIMRTLGIIKSEAVAPPGDSEEVKVSFGSRRPADVKKELEKEADGDSDA